MNVAILQDNIKIAWVSIKTNRVRTVLTILIIAFGIMALVGILTAIDAIKNSLNQQFASMGANSFEITNRQLRVHVGKGGRSRYFEKITYREALAFKKQYKLPADISVSMYATGRARIKSKSYKSNPNVTVTGVDNGYLKVSKNTIAQGRYFSDQEIELGANVVVIGANIAANAFPKINPVGKQLVIGNEKFRVVGVFASKGSSMADKTDDQCVIPLLAARNYFYSSSTSYKTMVVPHTDIDLAVGEATATMRRVKKLKASEVNNFEISRSDNLANMLFENLRYVRYAATIIGFITLLGAAIGLMNIILVSVTERTKEIGIRKAMGATPKVIKMQFLLESVFIGQLGGAIGIILGILIGNLVAIFTGTGFFVPWLWISFGVFLCFVVSILAALVPAMKAAKLDPIIALHYE
jgi:putative ABC transport system permease protein